MYIRLDQNKSIIGVHDTFIDGYIECDIKIDKQIKDSKGKPNFKYADGIIEELMDYEKNILYPVDDYSLLNQLDNLVESYIDLEYRMSLLELGGGERV